MEKKFAHAVYVWLRKNLTQQEKQRFEETLQSLKGIRSLDYCHIGTPADTHRPVIDRSYDYNLLCLFKNKAGHDAYQADPIHDRFRDICSPLWERILIYDSVEQ